MAGQVWKKNVPYLYEIMISHLLEWPSLTVQWLPDKAVPPGRGVSEGRLVLGTHAPEPEQNFLMIAKVAIPGDEEDVENRKYDEDTDGLPQLGPRASERASARARVTRGGGAQRRAGTGTRRPRSRSCSG